MAKIAKKASPKASSKKAPKAKAKAAPQVWGKFDREILKTKGKDWSAKQVATTRATHHGVTVGGKPYTSAWQAFRALNLGSASICQTFRKALKLKGKLTYNYKGKAYNFALAKD